MHTDTSSENRIVNRLKRLVDSTSEQLQFNRHISIEEAIELIRRTHVEAEKLIPNQMELYQIIYTSRFRRLFEQFVLPRALAVPINRHKPYS